jgi:succinate dehydrogenase / fumarate reductase, iron-sulfur subunit
LAEFTLPRNSKITKGRTYMRREAGERLKTFKIYRYDPGQQRKPALGYYHDRPRQMRADGSRRADQDQERDRPDLTFRRSCREGFAARAR